MQSYFAGGIGRTAQQTGNLLQLSDYDRIRRVGTFPAYDFGGDFEELAATNR
jgi:hypothetical protein